MVNVKAIKLINTCQSHKITSKPDQISLLNKINISTRQIKEYCFSRQFSIMVQWKVWSHGKRSALLLE